MRRSDTMKTKPRAVTTPQPTTLAPQTVMSALLLCLVVVAYLPALRCGFIWDDNAYVTENATLRDLAGLKSIWMAPASTPQYYPLVHTSFWLEYHLWGLQPWGYHAVNVLLHALGAILLYKVLLRLDVRGAWLAAAIFAVHPVQVESVAWVTERKNVLSAVFYFASALSYFRFKPVDKDESLGKSQWAWYAVSLLLFVAALLSKTVTCTLPAALLLARWWKVGKISKADVLPLVPFFAMGAGLGFGTVWLERHHVGAEGPDWLLTPLQRILIAGRALWFYAAKLIWPVNLTFSYPRWEINPAELWQWIFPIAASGVLALLWLLRPKLGRGPLFAVLYFAVTLSPALGFFNIYPMRYSFVADHFQYLASIGLIALFAAWASRNPQWAKIALLIVLVALTFHQTMIYRNYRTVWIDTLGKNPRCWLAWNNLGLDDLQNGKVADAKQNFEKSLAINPRDPEARYNLGNAHLQNGELSAAAAEYKLALELKPAFAEAESNLGNVLFQLGQMREAIEHWKRAVDLAPSNAAALNNLAWMLATCPVDSLRDGSSAVTLAERANQLTGGDNPRVLRTLAAAYAEAGRFAEAIQIAKTALALATTQGDSALANDLAAQVKLHQAGSPMHGSSQIKP
jgi:tetratricopeptide (TPR) repeat protein